MLGAVNDAARRARARWPAEGQALIDRPCAQGPACRQVGTKGWSLRSNQGMVVKASTVRGAGGADAGLRRILRRRCLAGGRTASPRRLRGLSFQAVACQSVPSRSMAFRMTSSLRMQATRMTFGFFPASRSAKAAMAGLWRRAVRAAM